MAAVCQSLCAGCRWGSEGVTRGLWGRQAPMCTQGPGSWEPASRAWSWGSHLGPWARKVPREPGAGEWGCFWGNWRDRYGALGLDSCRATEVGLGRGPQWSSAHFALLLRKVARATGRGEGLCLLSNFLSISVLHPDGRVPSLESLAPVKVSWAGNCSNGCWGRRRDFWMRAQREGVPVQPFLLHLFASLFLFGDKSSVLSKICFTCAY